MRDEDQEKSKSGAPIIRYKLEERKTRLTGPSSQYNEHIADHIKNYVGDVSLVYHEVISDLVHLDINIVDPTDQRPYYSLVTSGMSDIQMKAPDEYSELSYAELMLCLPKDWPLSKEAIQKEENYWPLRTLRYLARFPHAYDTWLWASHTIPNGDPPEPFAENTEFSGVLLMYPRLFSQDFWKLRVFPNATIHFLSVLPLYKEEMEFKLDKGLDPLLDRFEKTRVTELMDISRRNVCKRSLFRL